MSALAEAEIGAALARCAEAVDPSPGGRWRFVLANGGRVDAHASLDDRWLGVAAVVGGAPVPAVWTLLAWNAGLPGGARFVPRPQGRGIAVRADVCLDADVDVGLRVREACAGLLAAQAVVMHGGSEVPPVAPETPVDVPALCREAGWDGIARDGGVVVELDVPGAFHQAVVAPRPDGGVVASVPLADAVSVDAAPAADVCREAVGLLCLRTGGAVRLVRAVGEDVVGARFEVALGAAPSAAEVRHACAALSVACRVAAREAAVLRADEAVAHAYLTQWVRNVITITGGES